MSEPFDGVLVYSEIGVLEMTREPWVLVVSGSSSSGKSTLCRSLIDRVPSPTVLVEADRAFPYVHAWPAAGPLPPAIVVFHRSLLSWWKAGANVIVDGSLPQGGDLRAECFGQLPRDKTFTVVVTCSLDELRRREAVRPEPRPAGWAEEQVRRRFDDDLAPIVTVDTSDGLTDRHTRAVLGALQSQQLIQ